jgi:hypothetical protein
MNSNLMHLNFIRRKPSDAERYAKLRREMLSEAPWAFTATPEDDLSLDLAHLRSSLGESEHTILAVEAAAPPAPLIAAAGGYRMKNPRTKIQGTICRKRLRTTIEAMVPSQSPTVFSPAASPFPPPTPARRG